MAFPYPSCGSLAAALGQHAFRSAAHTHVADSSSISSVPSPSPLSLLLPCVSPPQIEYPEIEEGSKPRHRIMSSYEQRKEPWSKEWQYLLFAAEPYVSCAPGWVGLPAPTCSRPSLHPGRQAPRCCPADLAMPHSHRRLEMPERQRRITMPVASTPAHQCCHAPLPALC